jgi:hypothetical protein
MNNAIKVGMALAGAAAIAVGGTAFTAANTMGNDPVAGWGESGTISGVTVTNAAFLYSENNELLEMDEIIFTVQDMGTDEVTAKITPTGVDTPTQVTCTPITDTTIQCGDQGTSDLGWLVADLTSYELVVQTNSISSP